MNRKTQPAAILAGLTLLLAGCSRAPEPEKSPNPTASAPAPAAVPPGAPPGSTEQSSTQPPPTPAPANSVPAEPPPPPKPTVVPTGTAISARIGSELSSKSSHNGDEFVATVTSPVKVKGVVLIPAGSTIHGVVTEAKSAGKFKGEADLMISAHSIVVGGQTHAIQVSTIGSTTKGKGKRTAGMVGGGAAGGALIGGIAGGGKGALIGGAVGAGAGTAGAALTGNNRDITMPAETIVTFRLTGPLKLGASS
jgi:hypothetical protein